MPRTLPLYDPTATPATWCERMSPGEFAVHTSGSSVCEIFLTLPEAETHATDRIITDPNLRCRIYDHHGFIGEPLREFAGTNFRSDTGLSPRYLRILGFTLVGIGAPLFAIDWQHGFRYGWPGFIGSRMLIFGVVVMAFYVLTRVHEAQKAGRNR